MDEQRKFFRIKNKGEIHAQFEAQELIVIDMSACSAAVKTEINLPPIGIVTLKINLFSININFELLRKNEDGTSILIFYQEEQTEKLLPVLKKLRKD
jgi:hypothetical protein